MDTPFLALCIHYSYGSPTLLHTEHMSLQCQEGTQQGYRLGMVLFSLVSQPVVLNTQAQFRPLLNARMADDGNFVAPIEDILKIYEYINNEG